MKKANSIELLPSSRCDRRWSFRQQSFHGSSERKEQDNYTLRSKNKSAVESLLSLFKPIEEKFKSKSKHHYKTTKEIDSDNDLFHRTNRTLSDGFLGNIIEFRNNTAIRSKSSFSKEDNFKNLFRHSEDQHHTSQFVSKNQDVQKTKTGTAPANLELVQMETDFNSESIYQKDDNLDKNTKDGSSRFQRPEVLVRPELEDMLHDLQLGGNGCINDFTGIHNSSNYATSKQYVHKNTSDLENSVNSTDSTIYTSAMSDDDTDSCDDEKFEAFINSRILVRVNEEIQLINHDAHSGLNKISTRKSLVPEKINNEFFQKNPYFELSEAPKNQVSLVNDCAPLKQCIELQTLTQKIKKSIRPRKKKLPNSSISNLLDNAVSPSTDSPPILKLKHNTSVDISSYNRPKRSHSKTECDLHNSINKKAKTSAYTTLTHKNFTSMNSVDNIVKFNEDYRKITGMKKFQVTKKYTSNLCSLSNPVGSLPSKILRIIFEKGAMKKLGFTIVGGSDSIKGNMGIYVKDITQNGQAAKEGTLKIGDEILAVNGKLIQGLTHAEALQEFRSAKPGKIILYISRKD